MPRESDPIRKTVPLLMFELSGRMIKISPYNDGVEEKRARERGDPLCAAEKNWNAGRTAEVATVDDRGQFVSTFDLLERGNRSLHVKHGATARMQR